MRILTAGGGSGGHVTPVVAVLAELKKKHPEATIRFWCDRKFGPQAKQIVHTFDPDLRVDMIVSGKFRRYHSLSIWRQLARPFSIVLPNIVDAVKVIVGIVMSFAKLLVWRPNVIFLKGGFVCLPIGMAAHALRIPFVIHDSDAHPGLTNRILARWASAIATGAPLEYYSYPASTTRYTGTPVDSDMKPPTEKEQRDLKIKLGFDADRPLLLVTGGGLGAQRINQAIAGSIDILQPVATTVLISGKGNYQQLRQQIGDDTSEFKLFSFISGNMKEYMAAADVVVARAGATTMLELASLARPSILVPSIYLTGGHQLTNARVYQEAGAARVVDEKRFIDEPHCLAEEVIDVLRNDEARHALSQAIRQFTKPHAASDVADMVLEAATKR